MSAYAIFIREKVIDESELKTYSQKAPAAMAGHSGKTLAMYGRQEVLEGQNCEGVVLLEFPTFEEAKNWYYSDAYQEACKHRFNGAEYRAVIVEGV
jgi:uncharacterized protein (DUF1330 family)